MGYSEIPCALCNASFNIARIRTIDEPPEAGWSTYRPGSWLTAADDHWGECSTEKTGCCYIVRQAHRVVHGNDNAERGDSFIFFDSDDGQLPVLGQRLPVGVTLREKNGRVGVYKWDLEHIAGPTCDSQSGYKGTRISAEEMRGCQTMQSLVPKQAGWSPESDDFEFELKSDHFLSGICDGMPDRELGSPSVSPARHGVETPETQDPWCDPWESDSALPFHPWCFGTFMHISRLQYGHVDTNRLMEWFDAVQTTGVEDFRDEIEDEAMERAQDQWWCHVSGDEYLAANPFYVPQLRDLINKAISNEEPLNPQNGAFNRLPATTQTSSSIASDPFLRLPGELQSMVLDGLGSKDIASLRLASRAFHQLPISLWHRLLRQEMPWLWELWSDDKPYFWATVTEEDIIDKAITEPHPIDGSDRILSHTIDVEEHLSRWAWTKPPMQKTNWYLLYCEIARSRKEIKGLRNRERIWDYQERLLSHVMTYSEES